MHFKAIATIFLGALNLIVAGCVGLSADYRGREEYRYPDSYSAARLAKGSIEIESKGFFGDVKYKEMPSDTANSPFPNSPSSRRQPSSNDGDTRPAPTTTSPYWDLLSRVVDHRMPAPRETAPPQGRAVPQTGQEQLIADHGTEDIQLISDLLEVEQLRQSISDHPDRSMLPINRDVVLKCVLPPTQSVKETSTSLAATLEGLPQAKVGKAQLDARFADKVVRLFEQTERTVFLQYALFRMCEMTVNSPAEFRNVFPIMLHRLIRQSATLNQEAAIVELKHATEEERTFQEKEKTERARLRMECVSEQMKRAPAPTTDEVVKLCGPSEVPPALPLKPTLTAAPIVH